MSAITQAIPAATGTNSLPDRRFSKAQLTAYLRGGHRAVEGWLTPLSAQAIVAILEEQTRIGIGGAVAEIGIHHGKLFLVEYLATLRGETAVAIDVFEQQELNTDHSGEGDREQFLTNVKAHAGSTDGLAVIMKDSLQVTAGELLGIAGPTRFFSIDGGHTEECTRNDLALAEAVLTDGGVIVLDDYFNHEWPDVSVGTALHFHSGSARTRPFAITPNKVFFAEPRYHQVYKEMLKTGFAQHYVRPCKMFGTEVDIYVREGIRSIAGAVGWRIADQLRMYGTKHPWVYNLGKSIRRALSERRLAAAHRIRDRRMA